LSVRLLDVNILVALSWPAQQNHLVARNWFARVRSDGWATCSVTQGGLVRVLSTPALGTNLKPFAALKILEASLVDPHHCYWDDPTGFLSLVTPFAQTIRGHRQLTHAYLLSLAIRNGGKLATFDTGVLTLATSPHQRAAIEIVREVPD
jgi:toxin-antitoxin system PIN domain toxin